jgi:hypothetical protein
MAIRSCLVTIEDMEGVSHTVEVTADSLYEAVARGFASSRGKDWLMGIRQDIVEVSVAEVRVEHQVKLAEFTKWLERTHGTSPREIIQRQRARSILGMPARQ